MWIGSECNKPAAVALLALVALALLGAVKGGPGRGSSAGEVAVRLAGAAVVTALVVFGAQLPALVVALLIALACALQVALLERSGRLTDGGAHASDEPNVDSPL